MSFLVHALSQAERHTALTSLSCVSARQDAVAAQNRSFAAYRALHDLHQQAKQATPDLAEEFDICEAGITDESREASVLLLFLEKQLIHARKEEAEARLEHDQYLASHGCLAYFKRDYTAGPHGGWRKQVDEAFADYSQMEIFPSPPPLPAGQRHALSCRDHTTSFERHTLTSNVREESRPMEACKCAVRQAFLGPPEENRSRVGVSTIDLRTECLRWIPQNFEQCPEHLRADFVKKAKYVFGIVDALYDAIPK
ncbi:hypothetical protein LTR85_012084 [Meristemomyces frigidus]|nr:hypothetical protein LTR85_012084 [Meristemomyces frigidus]